MSNIAQLCSPPSTQDEIKKVSKEAGEKDADFLVLRLLNKRARVRLSPEPLDLDALPHQARLLAVANRKHCFAAATREAQSGHYLICSPLSDLHSAFPLGSDENTSAAFTPRTRIPLAQVPMLMTFANEDTRLVVGLAQGSVVIYDTDGLLAGGLSQQTPMHTFSSNGGSTLRQIVPNPGDMAELIAVLRHVGQASEDLLVEIFDLRSMKSIGGWQQSTPDCRPNALSWSPKGKQLALGLESGVIMTYSPTSTSIVKSFVPKPQAVDDESIISVHWLSNTEFYTVLTPRGPLSPDADQDHYIVSFDAKTNVAGDIKLNPPNLPFPGLRPPGQFVVMLRNWDAARLLVFVGDSASSDIGLIGNMVDSSSSSRDTWYNLSLEETSTPTVPMDKDLNDTVLIGLELDLTNTQMHRFHSASGEESILPPPPIMYAYASDGTVTGWQIVNTNGHAYPGMVDASGSSEPAAGTEQIASELASTPSMQNVPSPHFNSTSSSGLPSTPPSNGLGGSLPSSSFKGAFDAYANAEVKFGQRPSSFGPASSPSAASVSRDRHSRSPSPTHSTVGNIMESDDAELDILSSDEDDIAQRPSERGLSSMFGSLSAGPISSRPAVNSSQPDSGAGTLTASVFTGIKPAVGFGAFATSSSASSGSMGASTFLPGPSSLESGGETKPPSAFDHLTGTQQPARNVSTLGQPSFGQPSFGQPSFGQPSFGQPSLGKPSFGQPSFGTPSFGQPSFGTPSFEQPAFSKPGSGTPGSGQSTFGQSGFGNTSPSSPQASSVTTITDAKTSGGGFGAFAQAGPATFGDASRRVDVKPVWASPSVDEAVKKEEVNLTPMEALPRGGLPTTASVSNGESKDSLNDSKIGSPEDTKAGFPAPSSPVLTSSGSSPGGTGAFGQLKTSPFGFAHISTGFGAFGGVDTSTSPFFKPTKTLQSSVPLTFNGAAPTPSISVTQADTPKPTFGSPSVIGSARPVFGAESTSSPKALNASTSGSGFAAFSGASVGFGGAPSAGKAFSDLLRQKVDEEEVIVSSTAPRGEARMSAPISVFSKEISLQDHSQITGVEAILLEGATASLPTTGADHAEDHVESEEADEEDDAGSFLSESFSEDSGSEDAEDKVSSRGSQLDSPGSSPLAPQVPVAGMQSPFSPSTTPPSPPSSEQSKVATPQVRDSSTTPPGSPVSFKGPSSGPQPPQPSLSSTASVLVTPPLGLGRPSTRPARSSPLASDPINGDDDVIGGGSPTAVYLSNKDSSANPTTSDVKRSQDSELPKTSRPKTPPLLSAFGKPSPVSKPLSLTSSNQSVTEPNTPLTTSYNSASARPVFTAQPKVAAFSPSPPISYGSLGEVEPVSIVKGPASPQIPARVIASSLQSPSPHFNRLGGPQSPSVFSSSDNLKSSASQIPPGGGKSASLPPQSALYSNSAVRQSTSTQPGTPSAPPSAVVDGLQAECMYLFITLAKELDELRVLVQVASRKRDNLYHPGVGVRTPSDLADPNRWVVGDLSRLEQIMRSAGQSIVDLEGQKAAVVSTIRELESQTLKASTRKEEISRFSKASMDSEFARMLKARTLGPEHLETQSQLRRDIRTLRDRIQQLEDHIHSAKKRLNQLKTGKTELKAPSLDTINRIYRNVDAALEQQEDGVARLAARTAKLSAKLMQSSHGRGQELLDKMTIRRPDLTPNVVTSTAAALNAEMSANKLKRALLTIRNEPMLNSHAAAPPSHPQDPIRTPGRAAATSPSLSGQISLGMDQSPAMTSFTAPDISFPPFSTDDDTSHSPGIGARQRTTSGKYHAKSVQLKRAPPNATPSSNFDWGPLPGITPMKTLPVYARGKTSLQPSTPLSSSNSWATEGFGSKT